MAGPKARPEKFFGGLHGNYMGKSCPPHIIPPYYSHRPILAPNHGNNMGGCMVPRGGGPCGVLLKVAAIFDFSFIKAGHSCLHQNQNIAHMHADKHCTHARCFFSPRIVYGEDSPHGFWCALFYEVGIQSFTSRCHTKFSMARCKP